MAVIGTTLAWIPILAPILLSVALLLRDKIWRFDYLMPAELFLIALIGGSLLIWASIRTYFLQRLIGWALGIAVLLLVGGQVFATVTGLASGATAPTGWRWAFVLATLVGYTLALLTIGIGGLLLIRELFRKPLLSV